MESGAASRTATSAEALWHALDRPHLFAALEADEQGLSEQEAGARLAAVGPNRLPSAPPPAAWRIFARQFRSPLIYILALAAVVSALIEAFTDAGFIVAVLVVNAVIGGIQEWRAERSTRALQQLLRVAASVLRGGEFVEADAETLAPGDVVWLESGNRVPADIRLLMAHGLEVDESLLTGESLAVHKQADWLGEAQTPLAERLNMVYAGSAVVRGRAKGIVVATGAATHIGGLALDVIGARAGQPPLMLRLARFSKVVGVVVLIAAALTALLAMLVRGESLHATFLFGVALAVSAIPEGLPVAITVALAIATTRMARRNVIVRKLGAVEGLGSCTLVASDKTGTLTCNELTVRQVRTAAGRAFDVGGEGFEPNGRVTCDGRAVDLAEETELQRLVRTAVLCNEADLHRHEQQWIWRGDPTDVALLTLGAKLGWIRQTALDAHQQVNQIPFEPDHQFAASYHALDGAVGVFVKGAPERVLAMCAGGTDAATIAAAHAAAGEMAQRGYRVLALADGTVTEPMDEAQIPAPPTGLRLLGLVGMVDPLRAGVRDAVAACRAAGLTVCMVTGDHPATARAIGLDLGLIDDGGRVVSGAELEQMNDDDLDELVTQVRIFARVAPHQKLRLVEAAQRQGHFVAVTGDGVNDAPALRRANIGVAMGRRGTDVARQAADLVVSDDNFASIVAGIEEGRIAYNNIRNVIYLLVSTGAAEVVLCLLAVGTGFPLPLLPVQLLWLNLVTNGIQDVALAFEPGAGGELARPPRPPRQRIFDRLMIQRTVIGALVMGGVAFAAFAWMLDAGWTEPAARNALLLMMVLFENVHIGNCRSETRSAFGLSPLRSPVLLIGALLALGVHAAAMQLPMTQAVLGVAPVAPGTWLALLALVLSVFIAIELHKWVWARYERGRRPVDAVATR